MIEYFAMSVSYTPIPSDWRDVTTRLVGELKANYGMIELPRHFRWVWGDVSQHTLNTLRWYEIDERWFEQLAKVKVPTAPREKETWLSLDAELAFDRRTYPVDVRVRAAAADDVPSASTCVELWFPTYVHMDIFRRNMSMKEFVPEAKAAVMRVLTGIGTFLGAEAFAYQNATEDSLFGPPSTEQILKQLDVNNVWFLPERPYKIAGIHTQKVPPGIFEPDEDDPPWHYRRAGYDIYDSIWPDREG